MTNVVWIYDAFENNFEIKHKLEKCLKKSSLLVSDEHFFFKFFFEIDFLREISPK